MRTRLIKRSLGNQSHLLMASRSKAFPHTRMWLSLFYCLLLGYLGFTWGCSPPSTAEECAKSDICKIRGLCSLVEDQCAAVKEQDCRQSRFCMNLGECTVHEGRCIATREDDCRNSTECKNARRCIPSGGECIEINPGYCRISNKRCASHGECSLDNSSKTCVARNPKDCAASTQCKTLGLCHFDKKTSACVIESDKDCATTTICKQSGKCKRGGPPGARKCVAGSHSDCLQSDDCKNEKLRTCAYSSQRELCVRGDIFCTQDCTTQGRCTWTSSGSCIVADDKDCQKSDICQLNGKCLAFGGECIREEQNPCANSQMCQEKGECTFSNRACIAATHQDCIQSVLCQSQGYCRASQGRCIFSSCIEPCKRFGFCTSVVRGNRRTCVARTERACQGSKACIAMGLCKYKDDTCILNSDCKLPCAEAGRCVQGQGSIYPGAPLKAICIAKSNELCEKSKQCREHGLCKLQGEQCGLGDCTGPPCRTYGRCKKVTSRGKERCRPTDTLDCTRSQICLQKGSCTLQDGDCRPNSNADCAKSQECLHRGLCTYDSRLNSCVTESESCHGKPCTEYGRCQRTWVAENRRYECTVESTDDCIKSSACRDNNLCTRQGNQCVETTHCKIQCQRYGHCTVSTRGNKLICTPTEDNHCLQSELCKLHGQCSLSQGRCVVLSSTDCQKSHDCIRRGLCLFDAKAGCILSTCSLSTCSLYGHCQKITRNGQIICAPLTDNDCKQSQDCTEKGLCKRDGDRCVLDTCQGTPCTQYGRCGERTFKYFNKLVRMCAPTSKLDCSASQGCRENGACQINNDGCVPLGLEDCMKSNRCRQKGACRLKAGKCQVLEAVDCSKSTDCTEKGLCDRVGTVCGATKFEHCEKSTICSREGKCKLSGNQCITAAAACENTFNCILKGLCKSDSKSGNCIFSGCGPSSIPCKRAGRCQENKTTQSCEANSNTHCQNSEDCKKHGLCKLSGTNCSLTSCANTCKQWGHCTPRRLSYLGVTQDLCIATSTADCKNSTNCKQFGYCTRQNNTCQIVTDQDCAKTTACKEQGVCRLKEGKCQVSQALDCENSLECKKLGACDLVGSKCGATKFSHCQTSEICYREGKCKLEGNQCVADSSVCEKTFDCILKGLCQYDPKSKKCIFNGCGANSIPCTRAGLCKEVTSSGTKSCVADSDKHCQESEDCKKQGLCKLSGTKCGLTDCKGSACTVWGRCTPKRLSYLGATRDLCIADSQTACTISKACTEQGFCKLKNSTCVPDSEKDCFDSSQCKQSGICRFQNGRCIRSRDVDCKASTDCKKKGLCALTSTIHGSICAPSKIDDCSKSEDCEGLGTCSFILGKPSRCVATAKSCEASQACRFDGWCTLSKERCVLKDCKGMSCTHHGRCKEVTEGGTKRCTVGQDDDCKKSLDCAQRGLCTMDKGKCVLTNPGIPNCNALSACKVHGRCSVALRNWYYPSALHQLCIANLSSDCSTSSYCKSHGACQLKDEQCYPQSSTDCKNASKCLEEGFCKYQTSSNTCEADEQGCKNSTMCKIYGKCSVRIVGGIQKCVPTSYTHCRNSLVCIYHGRCHLYRGECTTLPWGAPCRDACRVFGRCKAIKDTKGNFTYCSVDTDANCQKSEVCKFYGRCKKSATGNICDFDTSSLNNYCRPQKGTAPSPCSTHGRCAKVSGTSTFGVKYSYCRLTTCYSNNGPCVKWGRCGINRTTDQCEATSDSRCKSSFSCKEYGWCHLVNGTCRAKGSKDCADSNACKQKKTLFSCRYYYPGYCGREREPPQHCSKGYSICKESK